MIRTVLLVMCTISLAACSGGTRFSSQRAQQPVFIPVTPGATPAAAQGTAVLDAPIAVTPGAVPVQTPPAPNETLAVITSASPEAPTVSLKPSRRNAATPNARANAPVARVQQTAARTPTASQQRRFAQGLMFDACRRAGRKAATPARCGCVQWVANKELTRAEQRKGAQFFADQQKAQDTRQSDLASNERFWKTWRAFGESAARQCRGT